MTDRSCDIILPVCDQFQFTKNCIESIIARTTTPYRIIVINNGKNEDTGIYLEDVRKRLGEKILIIKNETNVGWVKALNQGIAASTAAYICFQNDDTVVTEGWLEKMISILEKDLKVGIVNPSWEGRPEHVSIDDYGRLVEKKHRGDYIETDWARGFCVVLKKAVVDKIGNIDEIYGLAYFDDVDFSVRAIEAGFLVALALDTYVYHHRNVTFFQVLKGGKWNALHEKNKLIYYKRWGRPLNIAVVLGRDACAGNALEKIKGSIFYIARKQHHIDIWCPCDLSGVIRHTNVRIKKHGVFLTRVLAFCEFLLNMKKKEVKRYAAVFILDKTFGNLVKRSGLLRDAPLYADETGAGFEDFMKKRADEIKEDTKRRC